MHLPLGRGTDFVSLEETGRWHLAKLVESVGLARFGEQLLAFLDSIVGADHCTVFQLRNFKFAEVVSTSLPGGDLVPDSDLALYDVKRHLSEVTSTGVCVDVCNMGDAAEVPIGKYPKRQRVLIWTRRSNACYGVRILRSARREQLTDVMVGYLRKNADVLSSLVARHVVLLECKPNLTQALLSLRDMQECIVKSTNLSQREGEVCARIVYGLSSCEIALELDIGKESVMTYRKRAYQRLGISTQRELLIWYLILWSSLHEAYPS